MELARRVELIRLESGRLADAATGNLDAAVPSCPEWTMADLVRHVLQVHRSWRRIVGEGLTEPEWARDPFPADDELVAEFRATAESFADVLGATDPSSPCWTWGPEDNAGFVQRFQVQEAALHRWDAQHAVGPTDAIPADGAADALELVAELLSTAAGGASSAFEIHATDAPLDLTMLGASARPVAGRLEGTAGDLLLVLWSRLPLSAIAVEGDVSAIQASLDAIDID